jgi:hypothetical protein
MDDVDARTPTPPPVGAPPPPPDNGVVLEVGPGPAIPGVLVPGLVTPAAQAPVFGAHAVLHPGMHQNLLHRAQSGQLQQDQLHLLQQVLKSVQGLLSGFLAGTPPTGEGGGTYSALPLSAGPAC